MEGAVVWAGEVVLVPGLVALRAGGGWFGRLLYPMDCRAAITCLALAEGHLLREIGSDRVKRTGLDVPS